MVKEGAPTGVVNPAISLINISGKVVSENGDPVIGATVVVEGTNMTTFTNQKGEFNIRELSAKDALIITSVGYLPKRVLIVNSSIIQMEYDVAKLEETIIKGYYSTSRRLNTGSVSKISSEDISTQPVSNPLGAIQGLVPGLQVIQRNGLPGSNFSVRIRGQNSIQSGNNPFYIIDGVPFLNDNDVLTQKNGLNANSPFNTIDPSEIESIEILKDADATAIYGSRGANGVILINTKKGKNGKIVADINLYNGWGKVSRTMKFLDTQEYIAMRKEAFRNDGVAPSAWNAYDFLIWDTTRYTDFTKLLIGNTAHLMNVTTKLSGGNDYGNFSLGANYYKESTVFPGNNAVERIAANLSIENKSVNEKFRITTNISLANNNSNLISQDLTQYVNLPPLLPKLEDSTGKLNWNDNGFSFFNPLSNLLMDFDVNTNRISASSLIQYKLSPKIKVFVNLGYNNIIVDEKNQVPISAQDPQFSPYGSAFFGTTQTKNFIIEPQFEYKEAIFKKSEIQFQIGSTLQQNNSKLKSISASGFTNDALLNSTTGAKDISSEVTSQLYKYNAVFGRLTYNFLDKYIINLTGRRDGSSKFGPNNRFANFWAIGAGWNFSSEKFIKENISFLQYGKLRGSYGITGNDLIGNYNYLDLFAPTQYQYNGQSSLFPVKLFNSDYSWESIKKLNIALELGLIGNKLFVTTEWFVNKSSDQIIYYNIPSQTGFTSVLKNFPGVVKNNGFELSASIQNIATKTVSWKTTLNFTTEKNRLLEFPGLEESSYSDRYIIGKSLNIFNGPAFWRVDPETGIYQFLDRDKNSTFSPDINDNIYLGTTDPKFYGGLQNRINIHDWQFDFLFEFKRQLGSHPVYRSLNSSGGISNQPRDVLDRWQKPGDNTSYQQHTQKFGPARLAMFDLYRSGALLTDASFLRLKNFSISYSVPEKLLNKWKIQKWRLYMEGQNLFVITSYKGVDPENQSLFQLPPLRKLVAGIQLSF